MKNSKRICVKEKAKKTYGFDILTVVVPIFFVLVVSVALYNIVATISGGEPIRSGDTRPRVAIISLPNGEAVTGEVERIEKSFSAFSKIIDVYLKNGEIYTVSEDDVVFIRNNE